MITNESVEPIMLLLATCVRLRLLSTYDGNRAVEKVLLNTEHGMTHDDAHAWELMLAGEYRSRL